MLKRRAANGFHFLNRGGGTKVSAGLGQGTHKVGERKCSPFVAHASARN